MEARSTYNKTGFLSLKYYKNIIRLGLIDNCPAILEYVKIAEDIVGTSIIALKGKTTRKIPTTVVHDYITVSKQI